MAPATTQPPSGHAPKKLSRLPKNAKIHKRPLLRPQIPSPRSGRDHQKVVYVSTKTPFMSAVKRVRGLLSHIYKRGIQADLATQRKRRSSGKAVSAAASLKPEAVAAAAPESVVVKATGKAIDKALNLGLFFQRQQDLDVKIRTGTVGAIDDIKVLDELDDEEEEGGVSLDLDPEASMARVQDLPESRIRNTSVVEVIVTLQ